MPVMLNDIDLDGDDFDICNFTLPFNGTLELDEQSGFFIYQPNPGFHDQVDLFNYTICDDDGNTGIGLVTIVVGPCEYELQDYCTAPLTPLFVCLEFCNPEASISHVQTLFECNINLQAQACFSYVPLPAFEGQENITVTACDDADNCEEIELSVFVGDCQDGLIAEPQSDPIYKTQTSIPTRIQIFDIQGRLLADQAYKNFDSSSFRDLPTGLYICRSLDKNGNYIDSKVITN